ncbi:MAG TPA: 2-hydroxyacid dehydrogenase [Jatrophihabitans sp.]|nr:2-hydroxyacid dehydrogenase [Jatrophihabitans sp.]
MSRLCVQSTAVRDRLRTRLPDSELAAEAEVWRDIRTPPADAAEIEFWVPPPFARDRDASAAAVAKLTSLRVVQTQSAGVDAVLPWLPDHVQLCDARGVHGSSTSEWALTAILSVLREFPRFERAQLECRWDETVTDELAGKRVLIVGAGDVGRQLARRLTACDAQPVFAARTARDGVHGVSELPELLPQADVVVLLVPQTSETIGMVGAEFLSRMRDGALLVNAARGGIVRTDALLAELRSGRLRAALDVTDPEPLPADHPLWQAPNLLLTPHVGGAVPGLLDRFTALLAEQLGRYERGEPLLNQVHGEY